MKSKTVVIYKSKYGSTEKYAKWLAEDLDCSVHNIADGKKIALEGYKTIILGGGLYAGGISGISVITKNWEALKDKNIIVFTVGLADPNSTNYQPIIDKNLNAEQKEKIRIFHLRGGMDYKKLSFLHRTMMSMLVSPMKKKDKSELSEEDRLMVETYGTEIDFSDRKTLMPIIEYISNS